MKTTILTIRFIILTLLLIFFSGNAFSYILSVSPQINSQNLDTKGNIVVSFMYEMNASTLNDSTVIIDGSQSGRIHTTVSYNSTDYTATINPVRNLKAGENIHVYLTSGIKTLYYGSIYPYMYNFKVKPTGGSGIFGEIVTSNLGSGPILGMNTGDLTVTVILILSLSELRMARISYSSSKTTGPVDSLIRLARHFFHQMKEYSQSVIMIMTVISMLPEFPVIIIIFR